MSIICLQCKRGYENVVNLDHKRDQEIKCEQYLLRIERRDYALFPPFLLYEHIKTQKHVKLDVCCKPSEQYYFMSISEWQMGLISNVKKREALKYYAVMILVFFTHTPRLITGSNKLFDNNCAKNHDYVNVSFMYGIIMLLGLSASAKRAQKS